MTEMLLQILINTGFGLLAGVIGSFVGFVCWPWLRRYRIRSGLHVVSEPYPGTGGIWCRVVNDSSFSMGKAIAYISIVHKENDKLDPPAERPAFNKPEDGFILREGQLCWAVQEGASHPMRLDIYSREKQPLAFGSVEATLIEIFSEKHRSPARVFLEQKICRGTLKIVCMDCEAKEFSFEINPDDKSCPIRFLS